MQLAVANFKSQRNPNALVHFPYREMNDHPQVSSLTQQGHCNSTMVVLKEGQVGVPAAGTSWIAMLI